MRSVLVIVAALTAFLAPAADAATVSSLSVNSDVDDWIGDGVPRVAYPGGPALSAWADAFGNVHTGVGGVGVQVGPPPGEALHPYNWTRTERYPFQTSGRPGLTVYAGSRGCSMATGRLEVLDAGREWPRPAGSHGGPGRDLLDCGPGRRDRVVAGRGDRVRNCERRLRRRRYVELVRTVPQWDRSAAPG